MRTFGPAPEPLPEYHDNLVLASITTAPEFRAGLVNAAVAAATLAGLGEFAASLTALAPGLVALAAHGLPPAGPSGALATLNRLAEAGDIVEVTPVVAPQRVAAAAFGAGPQGISTALAMSLLAEPKAKSAGLLTGTSMIRVRNGQSRETVIRALAAEFGVTVAPVPRRYLLAKKAARARVGARMAPAAVPPALGAAWHLQKTGTTAARAAAKFIEPKQVKVAVLDTGIDETHPLLKSRLARYLHTYSNLNVVSGTADIVGHGTHVAGTVAAMLDGLTGVCGMCDCKLTAMKIFDDTTEYISQRGYFAYTVEPTMYLRAFLECADAGIQVVNLSIGGPAPPSAQEAQAINNLIGNGCVIVAAMGNERELGSRPSYPAAHPGIIAVGATDPGDRVTRFSNGGPHISLCAPGKGIWSTMPTYSGQHGFYPDMSSGSPKEGRAIMRDTEFGQEDGTSMASPQVAAAAAMYLALQPAARPVDVRTALTDSAEKVPAMSGKSFHEDYGYGRLDVAALLA